MTKQPTPREPDLLSRFVSNLGLALRLLFDRRVSGTAKLIPAVTLLYILSPLDLLPDVFLPVGLLDDLAALVVGLQLFIHSTPSSVRNEYRQRRGLVKTLNNRASAVDATPGVTIIEGEYTVHQDDV